MKIVNLTIAILAALLLSCNSQSGSFTITGELEGIADGTKIELIPGATHKDEKPVMETEVVGGKFTFSDTLQEPRLFYIKIADGGGVLPVMTENSKITVKGKPTLTETDGKKYYNFSDVTVSGSTVHEQYLEKKAFHRSLDTLYEKNSELGKGIQIRLSEAKQQGKQDVYDSLLLTDDYKAMEMRDKEFFEKVESDFNKAIISNKDSWWGPFLMLDLMNYFVEEQRELYNMFPTEVQQSYYGKLVKENLPRESWVGQNVTEFSAKHIDGSTAGLKDLIADNKYILLDFWASWCGPCKKEIPNLKKLYGEYNTKGFEIISISIDKDADAWKAAVDQFQLKWPNLLDEGGIVADLYKVKAVPQMFLIDNSGKIILDGARGEELAAKIAELLK